MLETGGATGQRGSNDALYVVVLVLLLAAMVHVYLKRGESEPPKWMGKLQTARPRFSFKLGFLLMGFFPTDNLTSFAVGSFLAAHGDPWTDCLPFVALTVPLLALPSLTVFTFGERAEAALPKVRDWMNSNSWIVNEVVIAFFVALTINNVAG